MSELHGFQNNDPVGLSRKIFLEGPVVDLDLPAAGIQNNPGNGSFPSACCGIFNDFDHKN